MVSKLGFSVCVLAIVGLALVRSSHGFPCIWTHVMCDGTVLKWIDGVTMVCDIGLVGDKNRTSYLCGKSGCTEQKCK